MDTLAESLRHLEYEYGILVMSYRQVCKARGQFDRGAGYYWGSSAATRYLTGMESSLIHLRVLDDFFSPSKDDANALRAGNSFRNKDRFAAEFCAIWEGESVLTKSDRLKVNKYLAHFSTSRETGVSHSIGGSISRALRCLGRLCEMANPEFRDRLTDIYTRARQNRAEPETPEARARREQLENMLVSEVLAEIDDGS